MAQRWHEREVDPWTMVALRTALRDAIDGSDSDVVVDCAEIPSMDETGARALLEAHDRLSAQGRELLIMNVQPSLWQVLHLWGVTSALTWAHAVPAQTANCTRRHRRSGKPRN